MFDFLHEWSFGYEEFTYSLASITIYCTLRPSQIPLNPINPELHQHSDLICTKNRITLATEEDSEIVQLSERHESRAFCTSGIWGGPVEPHKTEGLIERRRKNVRRELLLRAGLIDGSSLGSF